MKWAAGVAIWIAVAFVVAWLLGRFIRAGTSELQPAHAPKDVEGAA